MSRRAIIRILLSTQSVTDLIPSDKIESMERTQTSDVPAIVCKAERLKTNSAKSKPSVYDQHTVTVSVFDTDLSRLHNISEAVRTALDHQQGVFDGIPVEHIEIEDEKEDTIFNDPTVYVKVQTYMVGLARDGNMPQPASCLPATVLGLGDPVEIPSGGSLDITTQINEQVALAVTAAIEALDPCDVVFIGSKQSDGSFPAGHETVTVELPPEESLNIPAVIIEKLNEQSNPEAFSVVRADKKIIIDGVVDSVSYSQESLNITFEKPSTGIAYHNQDSIGQSQFVLNGDSVWADQQGYHDQIEGIPPRLLKLQDGTFDFWNLETVNAFGNNSRFTTIEGAPISSTEIGSNTFWDAYVGAARKYVICHFSNYGLVLEFLNGGQTYTEADAYAAASASQAVGFNDWRVGNSSEYNKIFGRTPASTWLSVLPSRYIRPSDHYTNPPSYSTFGFRLLFPYGIVSNASVAVALSVIAIRNHYFNPNS